MSGNFRAWMTERLFSSMKKLSSCEDSVGKNWMLRSKNRGSGILEPRARWSIVYCLCVEVEDLRQQGGTRAARGNYCRVTRPPTQSSLGQAWFVVSVTVCIRELYAKKAENRSNQVALCNASKRKMHCLDRELNPHGEEPKSKWAFKSEGRNKAGRRWPALGWRLGRLFSRCLTRGSLYVNRAQCGCLHK